MIVSYQHRHMGSICRALFSIFIILAFSIFAIQSHAQSKLKATYIIQGHFKFWKDYQAFLSEVASDLDIDLNIVEVDPINRFEALRAMQAVVSADEKPDFVVFAYSYEVGPQMLKLANDAKIYSFIVNTGVPEDNREIVGLPREKLEYWIGHHYPDDKKVGYSLADSLIKQKRMRTPKDEVEIIAVSGFSRSTVSEYRKEGLIERSNKDGKVDIKRVIYTNWETQSAEDGVTKLLQFYPNASVIWNASDSLALGGHFMGGGWSLVLLHDFFHEIDFKNELGSTIHYPLELITQENAQQYLNTFDTEKWKQIDFKYFSKHYNKQLNEYDFSLENLLKQAAEAQNHISRR